MERREWRRCEGIWCTRGRGQWGWDGEEDTFRGILYHLEDEAIDHITLNHLGQAAELAVGPYGADVRVQQEEPRMRNAYNGTCSA